MVKIIRNGNGADYFVRSLENMLMDTFSVRCSKCENVRSANYDDVFQFIAASRVAGWEVPDALENKPILCPTCKAASRTLNQP